MDAAAQGDKAIANSNWPDAIKYYTRALVEVPRAPSYYVKRSTAYSRLKPAEGGPNCKAALGDAETALILARERGKRELILDAQMRRAVALYQLGMYGDAGYIFDIVKKRWMLLAQLRVDRTSYKPRCLRLHRAVPPRIATSRSWSSG